MFFFLRISISKCSCFVLIFYDILFPLKLELYSLEKYKVIYTDGTVKFDSVQVILLQVILKRNALFFVPFLSFAASKCSVFLVFFFTNISLSVLMTRFLDIKESVN